MSAALLVTTTRERRAAATLAANPNRGKRHVSYGKRPRLSAPEVTSAVKVRKRRPSKRALAARRAFEDARIARILDYYAAGC